MYVPHTRREGKLTLNFDAAIKWDLADASRRCRRR